MADDTDTEIRDREPWSWALAMNHPQGWRQRLAQWLHRLATRIDRRPVMVMSFASSPPLSSLQVQQIILHGHKSMQQAMEGEVRSEAIERLLQRAQPELYPPAKVPHGQDE